MKFVKLFRFCILSIALKDIEAADNDLERNAQLVSDHSGNLSFNMSLNVKPLRYRKQIINGIYVDKDYDADISPNGKSLAHASYEINLFDVEDMDELKKQLTVHIKMRGTWFDSRITANFSDIDNDIILLRYH